jgi:hypothetical protein
VGNPRTVGQLTQRAKLSLTTALYRQIADIVFLGFKSQAIGITEFNAFARHTLLNAVEGTTPETAELIPANILISKGSISSFADFTIDALEGGDSSGGIGYSDSTSGVGQSSSDRVLVVVKDFAGNVIAKATTQTRDDESVTFGFTRELVTAEVLRFYVGACSANGDNAADSITKTYTVG